MNIEQIGIPSLKESAEGLGTQLERLAEQSVRSVKLIRRMKEEIEEKDRIISQQSAEIERKDKIIEIAINALKKIDEHYMQYIENNIEVDTAATRMDNESDDALVEIKKLEENPHVNT